MRSLWALICVLFITSMPAALALEAGPTPVREADAACAHCHERIVRSYLDTPMANASGMALEKLHPGTFTHAPSGTEYTIAEHNHQARVGLPTSGRLNRFSKPSTQLLPGLGTSGDNISLLRLEAFFLSLQWHGIRPRRVMT